MNKDQLYLLKADFDDRGKTYFCPGCAEILGLLEYYPALNERVEIRYADFARPRPELVSLIGEENQGCPVLILAEPPSSPPANLRIGEANGRMFIEGATEIAEYFASVHGTGLPHL